MEEAVVGGLGRDVICFGHAFAPSACSASRVRVGIRLALPALSGSVACDAAPGAVRALRALLWCRESCLRPRRRRFSARMSAKCLSSLALQILVCLYS